jgi:hypothetical protein
MSLTASSQPARREVSSAVSWRSWASFRVGFVLLTCAVPAWAAPEQASSAAAQKLFDQGRELMAAGRAPEACARFEESERLQAGLGTEYHLADCYETIGKTASAHALFREIAARARVLRQKSREDVARQRAEAVEKKLVKLRISVPHGRRDEVTIERDGKELGAAEWGLPVPVDPGLHRVRAFGPGLLEWESEVKVPADPGVISVSVPPLMSEGQSSFWSPTSRKVGAAAFGVGAVGLGLGTAFAVRAYSKNEDSNRAGCRGQDCPNPESLELRRAALAAGNRATWAFGVGMSGVAAGTVLFVIGGSEDPERDVMKVAPVAHARGGGLRVQGSF